MTLLISRQVEQKPPLNWLVGLVYSAAVALSLVGTFSDIFLDYTHSFYLPGNHVYTNVSPAYSLVILYLVLTLSLG